MRLRLWIAAGGLSLLAIGYVLYTSRTTPTASTTTDSTIAAQAPTPQGLAASDLDGDGIVYQDPMHPWIVLDAPGKSPDCGMDLVPISIHEHIAEEASGAIRIDPVILQNTGVRLTTVEIGSLAPTIRATARLEINEQQLVAVSSKIEGWVEQLYVDYDGARVKKGDPLLEIYSPALVSTQEEYLLALRNLQQLAGTPAEADARRLLEAARRRLLFWDITEEQIHQLEVTGHPRKTLTLYTPASGTVLEKKVVAGQQIKAGQTLFVVADLSTLWLQVDVYEQDLGWVMPGITADISLPYDPAIRLSGYVDYVYDTLDRATRTARARIVVPNLSGRLKPGMYALVMLQGHPTPPRPLVPEEAVVRHGNEAFVMVAREEGRFLPTRVHLGLEANGRIQVLDGLKGGEQIVARAQFLIDSEARLRQALGAFMSGHQHETTPEASLPHSSHATERPKTNIALPADDTLVVSIRVEANGFVPERFEVAAGRPVRLVVTRTTAQTCATAIQIPDLGIGPTDLPLNIPVVLRLTPKQPGSYTLTCGMNMLKGNLIVLPNHS